jgi:serine/threonine protein kinase
MYPPTPPQPPAQPPLPSRRLGVYELLRSLGRGGCGNVWLARHTLLKRLRAVKILRPDRDCQEAVQRFAREAEIHAQIDDHPNIAAIIDAGVSDGEPFLVVRYIDGLSLQALAERPGPLPVADACELIRQAAVGLQFAHEHGIVHRDIKPNNLMLDRTLAVKVLDFGLARRCLPDEGSSSLTSDGDVLGTPEYMAPEQTVAASRVDIRADLYALGCTLYFLLAARPPFLAAEEGGHRLNVMHAQRCKAVPPIARHRPGVPAALATLLQTRLLAKLPKERLAEPGQFAAALQEFTAGHDLAALLGLPVKEGDESRFS